MKQIFLFVFCFALSSFTVFAGNSKSRPDATTIQSLETITLFYKMTPKGLELSWSPANAAPSGGIKVTVSAKNKQPLYPFDGYVKWIPGTGHRSCVIPLKKIASTSPRYLRLCSVNAKNHSKYEALSNVVIIPPTDTAETKTPVRASSCKKEAQNIQKKTSSEKKVTPKEKQASAQGSKSQVKRPKVVALKKPAQGLVIGHKDTDISRIPQVYLERAKKNLSVWYGHTSHGSQITSGMKAMNRNPYNFNRDGSGGALRYVEVRGDLGHKGSLQWEKKTREYLDGGGVANVIMWSWCGGCSDNNPEGIKAYLKAMSQLEKDYPNRVFVYMTGHVDGSGEKGNLHKMNNQIRQYCQKNKKVLFDFADIESYDPDGNYYLDLKLRDSCDYQDESGRKNWAAEWVKKHPDHGMDLPQHAAHTHPLNGALKGRAFWCMMAHLSGWKH